MNTKEKKITRFLKREKGTTEFKRKADEILRDCYHHMFECDHLNSVQVIDIETAYNDYQKLHDDLYATAENLGKKVFSISGSTDVLNLVRMKSIRKACERKHISVERSFRNISKMGVGFSCILGIADIMCSLVFGEKYPLPTGTVLFVLGFCLLVTFMLLAQQTRKYDSSLLEKLTGLNEDELIEIFSCIKVNKSPLGDEGIFFVENFSKLNKLCRSCVIAYFRNKDEKKQIWFVFDYVFENSLKIEDKRYFEVYRLVPLSYEEKEALYKEYNLQNDIAKEYLNCIGIDILCGSKADVANDKFESHSLLYIKKRIEGIKKEFDPTGDLTRIFYCLVYMSSKYKYFFTKNQMISLTQNEKLADENLQAVIDNAESRVLVNQVGNTVQIASFINKILDLLEEYCFIEGSQKNRKYKFSYDILECFQEELDSIYPDNESVKRWVLVKLISNKDMFQLDRYFFDCSNLLVMSDFLEDDEFCILSSYLLKLMNFNCCWSYTGCILKRLCSIDESILKQYLEMGTVKQAAVNYLFSASDNESMQFAVYFLAGIDGCKIGLCDFQLDDMAWISQMEKFSREMSGYFKLLYMVLESVVLSTIKIGERHQNIKVEPYSGQDNVCEVFRQLLLGCSLQLTLPIQVPLLKMVDSCLSQIKGSVEASEFVSIVKEMLSWAYSERKNGEDRSFRNINTGMLLETSNYNLLYFVYGLLNMAFLKDRNVVYRNKNTLLDFISQSFFYFRITAHAEGITKYIDSLLNGQQSMDMKLCLAIGLLNRSTPCERVLQNFVIKNIDKAIDLLLTGLEFRGTEQFEDIIASLLLYHAKLNCTEFTEKIFARVFEQANRPEYENGEKICKYLHIILDGRCPENEMQDIMALVDEINQLESPDFAIWVLYGYYKINQEMVERIPQIIPGILRDCRINIGDIMIAKYLLNHSYYDCDLSILELYLLTMKDKVFPNKTDVRIYLNIIDKYAEDNRNIKYKEIATYNHMLSLDLYYEAVDLFEQRETGAILLNDTMEFILNLLKGLQTIGMKMVTEDNRFCALFHNGRLERNQEAERIIIQKFVYCSPIIDAYREKHISEDYYNMIWYMRKFPDICSRLVNQAGVDCMETIKQRHILYLVEVLCECLDDADYEKFHISGFDRNCLFRVKGILSERYNLRY